MKFNLNKSSWKKVKFGDVVKKVTNKIDPHKYDSDIVIEGGHINKRDFHIREYKNKKELGYLGPAFHMGFKKKQILYVSRNPHLMKVGYPNFDGICANTTYIMETINDDILRNDLIPFIMHSDTFIEQSVANVRGGVNPYVNWGDLACIEFPLPPKEEQAKLAKLLWAIDEVVERENKLMETVKIAGVAKLKDIFLSKVGMDTQESKFGLINRNWKCVKLEKLIEEKYVISHLDGNHGSVYPKYKEFVEEGVPFISVNCIEDDGISLKKAKYLTEERASTITKGIAQDGDILLAHNATVGPVCMLKTNLDRIILSTSLTYYRVNKRKINPIFLFYFMKSRLFQSQLESVMSQSTRNQVPITTQRALYFIIPPIETQNELIEKIVIISDTENKVELKVSSSRALQKTIINQIF